MNPIGWIVAVAAIAGAADMRLRARRRARQSRILALLARTAPSYQRADQISMGLGYDLTAVVIELGRLERAGRVESRLDESSRRRAFRLAPGRLGDHDRTLSRLSRIW